VIVSTFRQFAFGHRTFTGLPGSMADFGIRIGSLQATHVSRIVFGSGAGGCALLGVVPPRFPAADWLGAPSSVGSQ